MESIVSAVLLFTFEDCKPSITKVDTKRDRFHPLDRIAFRHHSPSQVCAAPRSGAPLVPLGGREGEDTASEHVALVLERELAAEMENKHLS